MTRTFTSGLVAVAAALSLATVAHAAGAAEDAANPATSGTAVQQPAVTPALPQVTNAEDCKRVGMDLAQFAEDKKLPDSKLDTLEDLMGRMTDFCAEQKFVEANALAKDLRTLIEQM